jgi:hypothetical protein
MKIEIGEHVCNRFIERFNPNLDAISSQPDKMDRARKALAAIVIDARYVSDNQNGVLLFNKQFNAKLIISNRKLRTIFQNSSKTKKRELKHHNAGVNYGNK